MPGRGSVISNSCGQLCHSRGDMWTNIWKVVMCSRDECACSKDRKRERVVGDDIRQVMGDRSLNDLVGHYKDHDKFRS